jgi:hypothetical protein
MGWQGSISKRIRALPRSPSFRIGLTPGGRPAYQSMQYLEEGIKLEVLWSPPPIIATRFPGFGAEFKRELADFERGAPFDAIVDGTDSEGYVRGMPFGLEPDIHYSIGEADTKNLHRALVILTEISFAAGAECVMPGLYGFMPLMRTRDDLDRLRKHSMKAQDPVSRAITCLVPREWGRMQTRCEWTEGRVHGTDNLFVGIVESFRRVGGESMLTIMALADRISRAIAAQQ